MNYFYSKDGKLDAYLFHEGTFYKSHEFLGAHSVKSKNGPAVRFVVWAPNAKEVYLMGDFNKWHEYDLPLKKIENSGLFNICLYEVNEFDTYKYRIISKDDQVRIKSDPYAFHSENKPKTDSKYYNIKEYPWKDKDWIENREKTLSYNKPISIYEVNLLSWKKKENGDPYSYRELAKELVA